MSNIIRVLFIIVMAVYGLNLNIKVSTMAQTNHYLKEDLELAVHDASLDLILSDLKTGKIVFDVMKATNTFQDSFERSSKLEQDQYEIIDIVFLDHSNALFPLEYSSSIVDFDDIFFAPTILAFVKTKSNAYFADTNTDYYIKSASYTYQNVKDNIALPPTNIIPSDLGFVWPVTYTENISSPFGMRTHPVSGIWSFHSGIDISSLGIENEPIIASKEGTVTFAGNLGGYGNLVVIQHADDLETRYAHLSSILPYTGQVIGLGQPIGYVGDTGNSTGPHLHFEVRISGKPYDPTLFFD